MRDESAIINYVTKRLGGLGAGSRHRSNPGWLALGLGDDAAVLSMSALGGRSGRSNRDLVLSCDSFLEGVHFLPKLHAPEAIGYKALARATSDLAAMGARPRFFLVTLTLPSGRTAGWLEKFLAGIARAAREFKMELVGGDTSEYSKITIGVTVGGDIREGHALTRSAAQPGDQIYVSGVLGGAQLALELLMGVGKFSRDAIPVQILERHLRPRIRLELGQWFSGELPSGAKLASAAIDTSDGLSTDLDHICRASGVGAKIYSEQLPTVSIPNGKFRGRSLSKEEALEAALHGGEDYELLFTVSRRNAKRIPPRYRGVKLTRIGEITAGASATKSSAIELIDGSGRSRPLIPRGWDSFRR